MRILLVTETLHAGGAETFVVRLANALVQQHEVGLINLHPNLSKKELINQIDKKVKVHHVSIPCKTLFTKIDGLLYRCGIDFSFIEQILIKGIKKNIGAYKPDAVHSHLFKTDYYVSKARKQISASFNHIITVHGDYLLFENRNPVRLLNYTQKFHFTWNTLNNVVVISEQQLKWIRAKKDSFSFKFNISKIFNGYVFKNQTSENIRRTLKLNDQHFAFGMVARGIKEKGWEYLTHAFLKADVPDKKLILVGEGDEITALEKRYKDNSDIIFTGYTPDPLAYIQIFDVCVFPSYYKGESLPTSIIEYLYCQKPILFTDVGEVLSMLQTPSGETAGLLIHTTENGVDDNDLARKMELLHKSQETRKSLAGLTKQIVAKFDMDKCVLSYLAVYKDKGYKNC